MGVQLREKKISGGKVSYYLDIYHNQNRWTEFLKIYVSKKKPTNDDKEKKKMALEIRAKRETELLTQEHNLTDRTKKKGDFVTWFKNYQIEGKLSNTRDNNSLKRLIAYQDGMALPFNAITPEWIKRYQRHLLEDLCVNTAFCYSMALFTALEKAVMQKVILQNPFRLIPRQERLKKKPTRISSFTPAELQQLSDTEVCKMDPQIKQAFFFSSFSGLRWGDVNGLKWSTIIVKIVQGSEAWFLDFEQNKTDSVEYLPLSEMAITILKQRRLEQQTQGYTGDYIFPYILETDAKKQKRHKHVLYLLKKWARLAGIDPKRMSWHKSRHSFATNLLESCVEADLWTVSKLLTHKTIGPTMIYAHVRDERKKIAISALPSIKLKPTVEKAA